MSHVLSIDCHFIKMGTIKRLNRMCLFKLVYFIEIVLSPVIKGFFSNRALCQWNLWSRLKAGLLLVYGALGATMGK